VDILRWDVALALLGVLVPVGAALYEFLLVGRKRLGYRVQMDTTATDEVHSRYAGALQQLRQSNGSRLVDPSFVLLRIENGGTTHIDTSDYAVLDGNLVGITVSFPGRRVEGMVVTELSDDFLRPSFDDDSGLKVRDGVIQLPKVPLNRGAHYKVLAALERDPREPAEPGAGFRGPEVIGGIKGGVGRGRIKETTSTTGVPRPAIALVCFLVAVILAQLFTALGDDETAAPLDCATGELTVTGSTAFSEVLEEAADAYRNTCPGAVITLDTRGSLHGLEALNSAADPAMLAFSDGPKGDHYPLLLPRPIALSLFTMVINEEAGVQDLSLRQIRDLYAGQVANWSELGGNDLEVRLVTRHSDSGTRRTFQQQVLDGQREPGGTSDNCRELDPTADSTVIRCERGSTDDVLDTVAAIPGTVSYSELGTATGREDVLRVRIEGQEATLESVDHGGYPFWETEYAYTYGEPDADSVAAGFLRYLTNEVGKDIIRSHSHRPCAELQNPVLCRPV
jgi:ABC-type phosphate transport system substrate-binding protein